MTWCREMAGLLLALAVEWAVFAWLGGPLVATGVILACIAAGPAFGSWLGELLFGKGGT